MNGNTGRKAAQRLFAATACEACGGARMLQRHHIDRVPTNNAPENIKILCQACHKSEHMMAGDWGAGQVSAAICDICQNIFQPTRTRRSTLCGNPECLREKGRQSAALRWAS